MRCTCSPDEGTEQIDTEIYSKKKDAHGTGDLIFNDFARSAARGEKSDRQRVFKYRLFGVAACRKSSEHPADTSAFSPKESRLGIGLSV